MLQRIHSEQSHADTFTLRERLVNTSGLDRNASVYQLCRRWMQDNAAPVTEHELLGALAKNNQLLASHAGPLLQVLADERSAYAQQRALRSKKIAGAQSC